MIGQFSIEIFIVQGKVYITSAFAINNSKQRQHPETAIFRSIVYAPLLQFGVRIPLVPCVGFTAWTL